MKSRLEFDSQNILFITIIMQINQSHYLIDYNMNSYDEDCTCAGNITKSQLQQQQLQHISVFRDVIKSMLRRSNEIQ